VYNFGMGVSKTISLRGIQLDEFGPWSVNTWVG